MEPGSPLVYVTISSPPSPIQLHSQRKPSVMPDYRRAESEFGRGQSCKRRSWTSSSKVYGILALIIPLKVLGVGSIEVESVSLRSLPNSLLPACDRVILRTQSTNRQ